MRSSMICRMNHLVTHLRSAQRILQIPISQILAYLIKELFIPTYFSIEVDSVLHKIYFRGKEGQPVT